MKRFFSQTAVALACLTFLLLPLPTSAQSSDLGLSIGTSASSVTRGGGVAVYALVTNNSTSKIRTTVSISSHSSCGTETRLGENTLTLEPGKSVALSVYYPIPSNACTGMYAVTISAESGKQGGGKNASVSSSSATAYVEVQ
ncbi:MAG TPA: hypothetical protein VLB68_16250 [Pyrinomonadaceae bacterium]|nr:hypothetical protein [Pyrinomonadaceae bacterium]